jgi:hypothetical protein
MSKTLSHVVLIGKNAGTPLVKGGLDSFGAFLESTNIRKYRANISDPALSIWCVDYPASIGEWRRLLRAKKINRTLIRYEPSVVMPQTHSIIFTKLFGQVLDIGRPLRGHVLSVKWPQTWGQMSRVGEIQRSSRVVVINANKLSLIRGELYSLRRKCMQSIESLDFYGHDWDIPMALKVKKLIGELVICMAALRFPTISGSAHWFTKSKNYLGATPSKRQTLEKYRVSLVIENSSEFLTEKLFDCFFAGAIPVYVGPQLDDYEIPAYVAIQAEPTLEGINKGISMALALDYESWSQATRRWLQDAAVVNEWSASAVFQEIARSAFARSAK